MAAAERKAEATAAKLATLAQPEGGAWATAVRSDARGRVEAMGLPDRRDEYWRYTDPAAWTAPEQGFATKADSADHFASANALTLRFVDGVFDADGSDALELEAAGIELLSTASAADLHWAKDVYGTLETAGQTPVARPMAALNTAAAAEGVLIHVTGDVKRPVRLDYRTNGGQAVLHHVIKLEPGATLTLLEEGTVGARSNTVMEVDVAKDAAFHHVRLQGAARELQVLSHVFARLSSESTFKSFTLSANGAMTRNEVVIELTGDDANATVGGAATGSGDFHHDDTIFITHDAVNCESRQVFKKVLRNGAKGVFQGKILVKADAQKTDGYQISQGLMLDDDSHFLAKPELEIYADDVACSHGSTVGAVDATALFYLTSRGVPKAQAEKMLVLAFLAEALEEIEDEALRETVSDLLADWLG